ncbi:DMT family transporter [Fluviibacterium sp. DFM31]|uniref:DMT family transporter n=1 Tax=Meridianimarinicoccus marinus TaxID=3231483 RepID=A0ABV3L391_9RHOB
MGRLAALVALTMLAFAANSVLNRMALSDAGMGPASFAAIRTGAGAVTLGLLVMVNGGWSRLRPRFSAANALALTAYMLGFSFAYVTLDTGFGALILFGGVQITMFAGSVLGGDRIAAQRWLGAGTAFAGLVWLLWPGGAAAPSLMGAALMAVAAVGWGIYSLRGRGAGDPLASTAASFLLAALPAGLVVLALPDAVTAPGVVLAVVSGAVTSGLGYALWYAVLPRLTASAAGVVQLTVPVIAMAGGALLLAEPVTLRLLAASVLVLGGVGLAITAPSVPARRG